MEARRILVIDDEPHFREMIVDMLRLYRPDIGEIQCVGNGGEGFDRWTHQTYDLVITDNAMPVMTGMELIGCIRNHPARCNTPIIMVSGDDHPDIRRQAEHLQAIFIAKPVPVAAMRNALKDLIPM